jgi:hypothetical protein
LEKLQVLAVDRNPVDKGLPSLPRQLKKLTLRECALTVSGRVDWPALQGLTVLDISSGLRGALPNLQGLPALKHLRELHLREMDIQSLEGLGRLRYLEQLNLAHTRLTEFDLTSLGSLQQLRGLTLFQCLREPQQLDALAKLGALPRLHHLNIGHNKLKEAPAQFWKWVQQQPALVELDLSGNYWEGNWGVPCGDPSPLPRQLTWLSLAECEPLNAIPKWLVTAGSHLQVLLLHGAISDHPLARTCFWVDLHKMIKHGLQQLSMPERMGGRYRAVDLIMSKDRLVKGAYQAWCDSPAVLTR